MAEDQDYEELQLEIEERILSLTVTELVELANGLKITEGELASKSRRVLSKLVRKTIDENVEAFETDTEKMKYLDEIKVQLEINPPPLEPPEQNSEEIKELAEKPNENSVTPSIDNNEKDQAKGESKLFTVYRRDFKIVGMVGPESQKDRLSFDSLTRQIESGQVEGIQ